MRKSDVTAATCLSTRRRRAICPKYFAGAGFVAMVFFAVILFAGCAKLLETSNESIREHQATPYVREPVEQIIIADAYEFRALLLEMITEHETSVQVLYHHNEGEDVQATLLRISEEIKTVHPVGAFAVTEISVNASRIVTHFEVDVEIEYKRTKEQIESVIKVSTERYFRTQLLNVMREHGEEVIIQTNLQLTIDEITEFVEETYYQNPRYIVMLPIVTVEKFPEDGDDRIFEVRFVYIESPDTMRRFGYDLSLYVRRNAGMADGETDSEIVLSLVSNLINSTSFDENAARAIHMHGAPNIAATAFGALVRGNAVGEGFAMAFKALCDELGIDSRVVLGFFDGRVHAWNIVQLYGYFYHIDVAMSVLNGIETAFLKTDAEFEEMLYTWDRENTVACEGELTLEDIIGVEDIDELENPENPEHTEDGENADSQENNEDSESSENPGNPDGESGEDSA